MSLIRLENAALAFGLGRILDRITLGIEEGDRIAIMGRNGEGKSTLLKVLAGLQGLDDGRIVRSDSLVVSYLTQDVPEAREASVWDIIAEGLAEQGALLERYHAASRAAADGDEKALERLGDLQGELDACDGWSAASRIDAIVSRFGFDPEVSFATLSGGMKRRVWLARALVAEPDLLLLDEPTNHLDMATIGWMESILPNAARALVFISHDRAFVDALADTIIELDRGRIYEHPGNLEAFTERQKGRLENEATERALFDKKLAEEEVWIRKGIEARRTRNEGRVRALHALREARLARRERLGNARVAVESGERSGKRVAELTGTAFGYGSTIIVQPFDLFVQRGDRIGIVGPNGVGKSTLIKGLLGQMAPLTGEVQLGTNLQVAYFDQARAQLDENKTVQEAVGEGRDRVEVGGRSRHILGYLEDFLFPPQRARQPVKVLSGGERNRLLLAKLFLKPANLLVLDEPTNDLDIETLELLEQTLAAFAGTVLIVSHDRAFLDNLVTTTLVCEPGGRVSEHVGGFSDLPTPLRNRLLSNERDDTPTGKRPADSTATEPAIRTDAPATRPAPASTAAPKAKRSYKAERELEGITRRIEQLEAEQATIEQTLADPGLFNKDPDAFQRATRRSAQIIDELESALAQWEQLERS